MFHELGHFLTAKIFNWKLDKIYIYPLGGLTKFNDKINKPVIEELLVNIMGPIFQIIITIFLKNIDSNILFFSNSLLVFNLLPIVPLDGGKLLNIIISIFKPFRKSMYLVIYISYLSYFLLLLFIIRIHSLFFTAIFFLLLFKIIEENKKISYYYNKFILERYLFTYKFKKVVVIDNIKNMFKYKKNIIMDNNTLYNEKDYLNKIKSNCK